MRSLFIRTFFCFWLTMTLVGTAVFLVALETHAGPEAKRHERRMGDTLEFFGFTATDIFEKSGPAAFLAYAEKLRRTTGIRASMYDKDLRAITAGQAGPSTERLAEIALQSGRPGLDKEHGRSWFAQPVTSPSGRDYVIVGQFPPPPKGPFGIMFFDARMTLMRLVESFIVSGIVCYLVVWYLTAPVRKLRGAAQRIGSGDFSARVGPEFARRKDELTDLAADFDLMAERIESLMEGQKRLLRDISHELRSPLARLNVALELARQCAGPDAERPLERIGQEAGRLNELIGQLLTLALLESGGERFRKVSLDFSALVRRVAQDAGFEAGIKDCTVSLTAEDGIVVEGSEELLRRAVENAVRNAIKYSPSGGDVGVSLGRAVPEGRELAVVRVRDHGSGLPEDELQNVFKPFYRVSDARDRQSGGTGIGLAITERAVRLHDGAVVAKNAPDGGLLVEITLPAGNSNPV
jgi:two-component system, OmpR family, sensor histidine kinase CpxA